MLATLTSPTATTRRFSHEPAKRASMGLRDIIRKKDQLGEHGPVQEEAVRNLSSPQFTFIRSDTLGQELIEPPQDPRDAGHLSPQHPRKSNRLSLDVFRPSRSRSASGSSNVSQNEPDRDETASRSRRLSQRLHLSRAPESSEHVPQNLPEIRVPADPQDKDAAESQWEQRATILAGQNEVVRSRPATPDATDAMGNLNLGGHGGNRMRSASTATSSKQTDEAVQEAIRLHEEGDLVRSTEIFSQLADPHGANNTLSQVLYGLALR